ncbi:MAG: carboxypeptidase regulatory-like domain-containing protein, partial [Acidobacteria bacterium]|nr:carboxypeptidase regulatory-like domain-containing protein [Acidobacteriota bacterium]
MAMTPPCRIVLAWSLVAGSIASPALAQTRTSTLRIVVVDPTGAVIVGAEVAAQPLDPDHDPVRAVTGERGEATFPSLPQGRYTIRAESPGFEPKLLPDFHLRGDARREMKLNLAKLAEEITVSRDARERETDPRGAAFGNLLTRAQIDALPDDPDDMEETLKQMAGPDAVLRVDGFRGGRLPPKSQIRGIRFRRDLFAAENHGGGMVFVDIMTSPGGGPFRGTADFTFRDESLNARNPMAPRRGPEQQQNASFSASGTLWKNRTGFSFTSNGVTGYDSRTIVAALPGMRLSDVVRRPSERAGFSVRLDHALTPSHALRASYQRNNAVTDNLGVGDFDLPERAYSRDTNEDVFRLSSNGPVGRNFFNESRLQLKSSATASASLSNGPALIILDSFNDGGAQIAGGRHATEFELASDMDFAKGRHSARAGFLLEAGRYRSDDVRNASGTFTFSSLEAFETGRPTTFTQRSGNPLVEFSHAQLGWYAQDDIRINKGLSVSIGVRYEVQAHLHDWLNIAPRAGAIWSPFRSGRTTFRGGVGIFYDWYDAQTYEQTLRVDGARQSEIVVRNPGFPDPYAGGGVTILPSGRIVQSDGLRMPAFLRANFGVERAIGSAVRLMAGYAHGRGQGLLRGRNVNAPDGSGLLNMDLWRGLKLSTTVNASSGTPYNVTTGFDDNGDSVSNDRPAGRARNSARGSGRWEAGGRLSWTFGFGQRKTAEGAGGGGPQVVIRTVGGPVAESSMGGFSGGAENKRWRFELYLAGTNLFNRTNPLAYSGVMTSPFFGRSTSAMPGRRIEVG